MSNPNNPNNPNDNLDEQPTRVAPAGSQGNAGEGRQTWQNSPSQPDGLGSQFAAHDDHEGETRAMPQNTANGAGSGQQYGSAPGQYPPVPGSSPAGPAPGSGPQYGTNPQGGYQPGYGSAPQPPQNGTQAGQSNGQWNSAPNGPQYGTPGQNQQAPAYGSGYDSANQTGRPNYGAGAQTGYASAGQNVAPAYATTGQQYTQNPADRQYTSEHGATPPARNGLGTKLGWGMVASALLAIIGVFGTWVWVKLDAGSLGNVHASTNGIGMSSSNTGGNTGPSEDVKDGWFVLIPALIVLALGVLRALGKIRKPIAWGAAALSAIATGVAIYDFFDIRDKLNDLKGQSGGLGDFSAGSGWGLTLCIIAGLLMLITSILSALRD